MRDDATRSLARAEQVLSTVRDALIETDAAFRITGWNRAAEKIYGWTREEVVGRLAADVLRAQLVVADRWRTSEELAARGHALTEVTHWTKAGEWLEIEASVIALHDESGEIEGYVSVNRDVTGRRRPDAIATLAGGIAHDLNSLLTAIAGYADLILSDRGLSPEVRADTEGIIRAAERAGTMTRGLLAFGRRVPFDPCELDLHALVRRADAAHRRVLGQRIELVYELSAADPRVKVDRGQLEAALAALVANAAEAMTTGGTLTIATRELDLDLPAGGPTRFVELSLADTGAGMDEDTLGRAFDPFFSTRGESRGLGLAAAHGIVAQSGGSIAAESRVGEGSLVRIRLPASA